MGRGSVSLGSVLAGQQPQEDTMGSTFDIHRLISTIYRKTSSVKVVTSLWWFGVHICIDFGRYPVKLHKLPQKD